MNRLSDADFAVYIRNIALELSREAKERGIMIDIHAKEDGEYVTARFGDYDYIKCFYGSEDFEYRPFGRGEDWERVTPEQIRLNEKPLHLPE